MLAGEQFRAGQELAVAADRIEDLEAVLLPDLEILDAVAGRGVDGAGALFEAP